MKDKLAKLRASASKLATSIANRWNNSAFFKNSWNNLKPKLKKLWDWFCINRKKAWEKMKRFHLWIQELSKKHRKVILRSILQLGLPTAALAFGMVFGSFWVQIASFGVFGLLLGLTACLILAPFLKEQLKFHPNSTADETGGLKMLMEVQPGRHSMIMQGGRPRYIIEGGKVEVKKVGQSDKGDKIKVVGGKPDAHESWFLPWYWWQLYMYATTGYHAYVPFFTRPYTYELPRFVLEDDNAQKERKFVFKRDVSDHVRVETTTWYFEYHSVDIQKVPFMVRGSVQYRIVPGYEEMALFGIDSWNILLDQALNGTIRNYLRANMTLDDILGETPKDIWEKKGPTDVKFDVIAKGIRDDLTKYMIKVRGEDVKKQKGQKKNGDGVNEKEVTLLNLGINIQRVEIVDFVDELPKEERARFFAAVIGREEGRAIHLRGQGTAKAEAELLAAHEHGGELSEIIIKHRALVDAAKGSDILAALAAGYARKQIGDK